MKDNHINIAYACNEAYMEQTMVSMISLFENNRNHDNIKIYFVDMGITIESKRKLNMLAGTYGYKLDFIIFNDLASDLHIKDTGRHIASVYAKIFFSGLKDIDRILYIDSDTVVVDDIATVYFENLENYLCAGVTTLVNAENSYLENITDEDVIINDGVVLINLKLWRELKTTNKCLEFIQLHNGKPPVLSEGTINVVCRGKIKRLHPRYNLMSGLLDGTESKFEKLTSRSYYSQKELDEARENPCIIHFLAAFYNRPWFKDCSHPLKDEYIKYRNLTEWRRKALGNQKLPIRIRLVSFLYHYLPINIFIMIRKIVKIFRG